MRDLPVNWDYRGIKDVLLPMADGKVLHQGWSPRCEPEPSRNVTEWAALKTTAIQDGWFDESFNKRLPDALTPRPNIEVHPRDILITCAGPRVRCGVACLVTKTRPRLMISGKMYRFRANESVVTPEFLLAYLRSPDGQAAIDGMKTGCNESGLNLTHDRFFQLKVPVAPLVEQSSIIATLDNIFSRSKSAREQLARTPRLVERYKQAILTDAFQQLSVGVGSQPFETKALGDVCDQERTITYGVIKLGEEVPNGTPCLRTSNVRWLQIDTEGMKRISPTLSKKYGRTILRGGEILVNVRGTLGGVAVVTPGMKGWNVSREVAVVPVDTAAVDSDYLAYWIASDASQLWLRRAQKGVAYTGINIADLKKLPVILPSLTWQRQIVLDIRQAHARISSLDQEVGRARTLLDRLDQATLAKAFRGELLIEQQRTITEVAVSQ